MEATLLHTPFDFPLLIQLPFLSGLYRYFCRFSRLFTAPFCSCGEVVQVMFHPAKRKFHLIIGYEGTEERTVSLITAIYEDGSLTTGLGRFIPGNDK